MSDPRRSPRARALKFVERVRRASRHEVSAYWRTMPVDPNAVVYESFDGNGILDNPEAIFRGILAAPDLGHLTHTWVLSDFKRHASAMREFAGNPSVRFVRRGSPGYYRALATSGYLINNSTFPPEFSKRPGQVYINTWHGTPLKFMGYDIENGALGASNTVRNFLTADILLAANHFMADRMYETAYKLKGVYRGMIVEEGYPRIDLQFADAAAKQAVRDRLESAGLQLGDRKVILYAPTWKGTSFNNPVDDTEDLYAKVTELETRIDADRYVVLVKAHQKVHSLAMRHPQLLGRLVPNEIPTNAILGVTEILVTDYSSIFFDFLATGRPVMFFTPDIEDYTAYRGLYLETSEWPGPIVSSIEDLAAEINKLGTAGIVAEYADRYNAARERFSEFEDGHATEKVLDIVFRNKTAGYRVRKVTSHDRPSILVYMGGMLPNGITSSALNLLDHIDHEKFDVSAFYPTTRNRRAIAKQREINPRVRQLPRVGGMNGSKLWHLGRHLAFRSGRMSGHRADARQNTLWEDEWTRCFGDLRFDFVVDFSGYGPFWSTLLLHSPPAQRSIWLHNDLASDAHRRTNGRRRMLRSLTAVFSLYRDYDHLVSVSPSLAEINRQALAEFAPPEKFVSALNIINSQQIKNRAAADIDSIASWSVLGERPEWARRILDGAGRKTFVCVGRLSEEKNHAGLLRAFARVHAEHPQTQLMIVGDGPLRHHLERQVADLGLEDAVYFVGYQANPHAIMVRSDCLVVSSHYEGQPMVILEARILGLPVVSVAFGSVSDALPEGSGLIVPATDEDLARGMTAFLNGEVPAPPFDDDAYNNEAMDQFYRAIGVGSSPESSSATATTVAANR